MSHAVLSPSAASRWLVCTPSARLELQFSDDAGDYAKEGSLAHEFGEAFIKGRTGAVRESELEQWLDKLRSQEFYEPDMERYAEDYADLVYEKYLSARHATCDAIIRIEEKIDLTGYAPEAFGTGDAIIIADGTLEIIDLKYGKGVRVSAVNNKQMMLYALGALDMFGYLYAIDTVRMTISQPRIDNVSEFELKASDLLEWGEKELKPRAAMAFKGEGDMSPGDHCRFCKAKARCRALAELRMQQAEHEFKDAELLTDEETAAILEAADGIKNWISAVEEHAFKAALDGKKYPGFKLVEGRSIRKYADEKKVAEVLIANGFAQNVIYEAPKLKTITSMEKLLTKKTFGVLLGEYVIKPQGKPVLVPDSDKRQEWSCAENDFKNVNV